MKYGIIVASTIMGLVGCVDTSSTNYPELEIVAPQNSPVTDTTAIQRPTRPEMSYAVNWSCVWDTLPTEWQLPGIQVEDGRAYAVNEWTRLAGEITSTNADGALLNLSGERLSNDGHWYPMAMEGRVFRDRESTLFGYWKGASCEADVMPVQAEAPEAAPNAAT